MQPPQVPQEAEAAVVVGEEEEVVGEEVVEG